LDAFVTSGQAPVIEARVCEPVEMPSALEAPLPPLADPDPAVTDALAPSTTPAPEPPLANLSDPERLQRCASWAAQLSRMTGPKVHSTVERAFVTAYVPLCREVARGGAPSETQCVAESWAEGFAQSYAAAFKTLERQARRPKMVRDVIELSSRWLGRYGAKRCQILLVDGLRFDLGQLLNESIERELRGAAVCADQTLLWAALPSNGRSQQLPGARDAGGRAPERGMAGTEIEELSVGSRSLFRLDRLAGELARAGEPEAERLGRLADQLARSIVPWMQRQPRDTLVVLFGDHGFHWQSSPRGTSPAQCGGALPEQVLVPASGWILGAAPRAAASAAAHLH
jgi:hypothetical protein